MTAKERQTLKQLKEIITSKFEECPYDKRTELFESLEKWAMKELPQKQSTLFTRALYDAKITQDIQITIALESALKRITK